jgi:ketosteroid isomerase-like protein
VSGSIADGECARIARRIYEAYASGDRSVVEGLVSEDLEFFSPADVGIDRERYFERCWPNSATIAAFEIVRLVESEGEAIVTYEARRVDGSRFRNTEVLAFEDGRLRRAEVYFGWNL